MGIDVVHVELYLAVPHEFSFSADVGGVGGSRGVAVSWLWGRVLTGGGGCRWVSGAMRRIVAGGL